MLQLLAKKLGLTVICGIIFFVVVYFYSLLFTLIGVESDGSADWSSVVILVLYILILFIVISSLKHKNRRMRDAYMENLLGAKNSFREDCIFIVRSQDFRCAAIAFNVTAILLELAAIGETSAPPLTLIAGTILLIVLQAVIFAAADICLWLMTFKRWTK